MLVLFIFAIATTSILPVIQDLGMSFVALAFAAVMLLRYKAIAYGSSVSGVRIARVVLACFFEAPRTESWS